LRSSITTRSIQNICTTQPPGPSILSCKSRLNKASPITKKHTTPSAPSQLLHRLPACLLQQNHIIICSKTIDPVAFTQPAMRPRRSNRDSQRWSCTMSLFPANAGPHFTLGWLHLHPHNQTAAESINQKQRSHGKYISKDVQTTVQQ
jgi:hypothetical protein